MTMAEMFTQLGSAIAGLMFAYAMFKQYFPYELRGYLANYSRKLTSLVYPYIQITFHEFTGDRLKRSEAYSYIQNYLSTDSAARAKRLKADFVGDSESLVLTMADHEEITDTFNGVKVWWASRKIVPRTESYSLYPAPDERRYYKLTFHNRNREIITESYIGHVLREGKAIAARNRQRKLYTNNPSQSWYGYKSTKWSHVPFEHPASFDTLAMAKKSKEEIIDDLIKFSKGKDYYSRIGKPWKRGYLLFGPPGTGKSTMIAAMANLLHYDVYDLELTTVKDNSELRKLLIETKNKSIIVIEDIDCSLDLTGQRDKKKEKDDDSEEKDAITKKKKKDEESKSSRVTLSGLLNFIDGIWSACGGERIIVFTTNFVDKLDPALIRRGRMDKHIEMSYCCFEAFKVLAKNYLLIESHELYSKIEELLQETNMTPADVAENLMPKSDHQDEEMCLKNLIEALEASKEEAMKKAKEEEEERKKAEEEEANKLKAKQEKEEKNKIPEEVKVNGEVSGGEVKENGVLSQDEAKESSF